MTLPVIASFGMSCGAIALCLLAVVRLAQHRDSLARRLAMYSMIASVLSLPVIAVAAAVVAVASDRAESKATIVGRGISEGLNAGYLIFPVGAFALIAWTIAVLRLKRSGSSSAG